MSSAHVRTALRVACLLAVTAVGAAAQDEPIGRYVIDIRGSTVGLGQNEELARVRRLAPNQLPSRGIAVNLGGHFYFLRLGPVTFGLGASVLSTAAHQPPVEPEDPAPGGFPGFTTGPPTTGRGRDGTADRGTAGHLAVHGPLAADLVQLRAPERLELCGRRPRRLAAERLPASSRRPRCSGGPAR